MTTLEQTIDPVELLERAAASGEDVYEACINLGIVAREKNDSARWLIGDLAQLVHKEYGRNRIGEFAKKINEPVDRVKEYRTVSAFWQRAVRADFLGVEALSYSHFRVAKRLKDMALALAFLNEAATKGWTVEATRLVLNERLGKPPVPVRLLDAEATVSDWDRSGRLAFCLEPGVDLMTLDKLTAGLRVRLVVMEGESE